MTVSFISYAFLVLVAAAIYALLPKRVRPFTLLVLSLLFYGTYDWRFLYLLIGVILMTYAGGLAVSRGKNKRVFLGTSIAIILTPLALYKYLFYWFDSLRLTFIPTSTLDFGGYGAVLIPVGLSFFTFQCLGYLIDVSRGIYKPEKNPLYLGLFVSFFPQLLAGPIERYASLSPQLRSASRPTPDMVLDGLVLLLFGLFLKISIGDRLGVIVDEAYAAGSQGGAPAAAFALYGFTFQLFADFAGYSIFALGAAKLFGIELTANFRQPFFSANIVEFWQRWHISLTRWIGDYLYRPIGRLSLRLPVNSRFVREAVTVFIIWIALGLWHGPTWVFILFGTTQATMMLIYSYGIKRRRGHASPLRLAFAMFITFNLVAITFGLIRAPSVVQYGEMLASIFTLRLGTLPNAEWSTLGFTIAIVVVVEAIARFRPEINLRAGVWRRCTAIGFLIVMITVFWFDDSRSFIYFRF